MTDLSASDIEDVREVFDLFDFWDGRDGLVDGFKVGDLLRCIGLNPTNAQINSNGGCQKLDVHEVFDLFDFWDGRDGLVDGFKVGELLRCTGLNPTTAHILANGGKQKEGEKQYTFEEILPIYKVVSDETDTGTFADFMEAFKTFDREGQGFVAAAETRHVLQSLGDRLKDDEVESILKSTGTEEDLDGNIKYEEFIKKVMAGPVGKK